MKRRWLRLSLTLFMGLAATLFLGWIPSEAQGSGEPGTWQPVGPQGGGANALALSPNFITDGVAFGGNSYFIRQTKTGLGLFKSTDGGRAWTLATTTTGTDTQITGVDTFAVSPNFGADGTVFAGTSAWLFKSTDAGATWTEVEGVGSLLYGVSAVAVAPDYATSGHVMATSGNALYVSQNGGLTWTTQSELGWGGALAYSPEFAHDRTAFAGGDGLWKTVNAGSTWTKVLSQSVRAIAVSPHFATNETFFSGGGDGRLYVTHDAGATWLTRTVAITAAPINALAVSPAYVTDTTLFLGCHAGLFHSGDGGTSLDRVASYPGPWVDALAISPAWPTSPTLLVGTPAGVYRTADGGGTWERHGFAPLNVSMLTSAQDGQRLFAGTAYQGLFQRADMDAPWTPSDLYYKTFVDVAAAPTYPAVPRLFASVTAGAGLGFYRSDNAGETWGILNSVSHPGGDWAFSPDYAQDGTLFVTGNGQVLRSTYYGLGANWEPMGTWPAGITGAARFVLLTPDYPADTTLWAAGQGVWRLDPGATLWVSATLPAPNAQINDIAQSPDFLVDQTLLAAGSGREDGLIARHYTIFRSTDAGTTWSTATIAFSNTTPLVAVAFSPRFAVDHTAYAISKEEVFRSVDNGAHWVTLSPPPGVGELYDVVAHGDGRVSVATEGGVWQYTTDWEEVVVNGGFEANGGWDFPETALQAAVTDVVTHTGRRAARIGVGASSATPTQTAYSSVRQTLTIPSDVLTATLHFHYLPQSDDVVSAASPVTSAVTSLTASGDLQYALILETGEYLFRELVDAQQWLSRTVDLSGYRGESFTLHFGVVNDGQNGHTGMYLDDVSLLTRRLRLSDLIVRAYLPLILRH